MRRQVLLFLALVALLPSRAADALPGPADVSIDAFKSGHPPFGFKYEGKVSDSFIATWTRAETELPSDGGALHRFTWTDPATKLEVTADVRTFTDFPAIEWVMSFRNNGGGDTPIVEQIKPLRWPDLLPGAHPIIHYSHGSGGGPDDFLPVTARVNGGYSIRSEVESSTQSLPFFNLQSGNYGVIGAIGWSGSWVTECMPNQARSALDVTSGMPATHLLLHAGEQIRTPRILLLPWHGDVADGQNLWRKLALSYYSPRDTAGKRIDVPICWGTWGGEAIDKKLSVVAGLGKLKPGIEVYWIDAGWYGDASKPWDQNVGDWAPSPKFFPNGLAPLGQATKQAGLGFLVWMDPEDAWFTSPLRTQHPDWFYKMLRYGKSALLRMDNPEAAKYVTDLVGDTMHTSGATWFRQDGGPSGFNNACAAEDAPNRVGMNEINYVTNFYAYWDALRTRIPNLQIDNCSGGGRRIDLETISRSVSLWRSDAMVGAFDPSMEINQAQGLIPWAPMSGGVWTPNTKLPADDVGQLYSQRSSYCAGLDVGGDIPPDWLKTSLDEYKEVRPYFYGDFYPLVAYSPSLDVWSIWQLDRPDLKSGVVLALRRSASPFTAAKLPLHAIDRNAQYDVEIRLGLDKTAPKQMTGKELLDLSVEIPTQPGSALVFYRKR